MILLDTHVLLWLAKEPSKLSPAAIAAIQASSRDGGIAISAITLWEIALLAARGKLALLGTLDHFVESIADRAAVQPITVKIAVMANQLAPNYPKDPADRLIGATALCEGMVLISADQNIRLSGAVRTIW